MNSKDLAIGVLSTTAVVLFVGMVLVRMQPQQAYASGMGDRGGDYIVVTGAMWAEEELLYVFNTAQNKMMVYKYDQQSKQIVPLASADMAQVLSGKPPQPNKPARRSRRSRP